MGKKDTGKGKQICPLATRAQPCSWRGGPWEGGTILPGTTATNGRNNEANVTDYVANGDPINRTRVHHRDMTALMWGTAAAVVARGTSQ